MTAAADRVARELDAHPERSELVYGYVRDTAFARGQLEDPRARVVLVRHRVAVVRHDEDLAAAALHVRTMRHWRNVRRVLRRRAVARAWARWREWVPLALLLASSALVVGWALVGALGGWA